MKTKIFPPPGVPAESGKTVYIIAGLVVISVGIIALIKLSNKNKSNDEN